MTINYDGLYECRFYYDTTPTSFTTMTHRFTLDVKIVLEPFPGGDPAEITLEGKDGTPIQFTAWVADVAALWATIYPATATLSRCELWRIPEGTFDGTFVNVVEIGQAGESLSASQVARQLTLTFRSREGGNARWQLMESIFTGNASVSPPYVSPGDTLAAFILAADSPVVARDNTPLIANIKLSVSENERLWRKRYRS